MRAQKETARKENLENMREKKAQHVQERRNQFKARGLLREKTRKENETTRRELNKNGQEAQERLNRVSEFGDKEMTDIFSFVKAIENAEQQCQTGTLLQAAAVGKMGEHAQEAVTWATSTTDQEPKQSNYAPPQGRRTNKHERTWTLTLQRTLKRQFQATMQKVTSQYAHLRAKPREPIGEFMARMSEAGDTLEYIKASTLLNDKDCHDGPDQRTTAQEKGENDETVAKPRENETNTEDKSQRRQLPSRPTPREHFPGWRIPKDEKKKEWETHTKESTPMTTLQATTVQPGNQIIIQLNKNDLGSLKRKDCYGTVTGLEQGHKKLTWALAMVDDQEWYDNPCVLATNTTGHRISIEAGTSVARYEQLARKRYTTTSIVCREGISAQFTSRIRPYPEQDRQKLAKQVQELLIQDAIRNTMLPWPSPLAWEQHSNRERQHNQGKEIQQQEKRDDE